MRHIVKGDTMTTYTIKFTLRADVSKLILAVIQYFKKKNFEITRSGVEHNYVLCKGKSLDLFLYDIGKVEIQIWVFRNPQNSLIETRMIFEIPKLKSIEGHERVIIEEAKNVKKYIEARVSDEDEDAIAADVSVPDESIDPEKIVTPWCSNCFQYKGRKKVCPHCNMRVR